MAADGKVVIITELDTDGVATGTKKLKVEMESLSQEADGAGKEMDGLFGKLFKADFYAEIAVGALQELGSQLVDFAADSVGVAADVKAANAQFSQTFKELEKDATKSLKSIEKQTGVTATRMQGSYTKIFAFTKSVGADSAEAMDIAERAMLAAADSAAYYDKTIEEATETLQSFLKGNYENDAALGIAATETTRNAEANRLYAKSFQELTEAQKVDVLLSMVEAGNQASGALGSAAREAEEWTNVTGEAQEAMRQFQAVIGSPVLAGLTPVIKEITEAIYGMIEATDAEKLSDSMESVTKTWADAQAQFEETSKEIELNALAAQKYVEKLKDLEKTGLKTAASQKEYANTVSVLNKVMPDLNLSIDEQTGLVNMNTDAILAEIEAMKEKALYVAYEEQFSAALKAQADAVRAAADAELSLIEIEGKRQAIQEQLSESTGKSADELIAMYEASKDVISLGADYNGVIDDNAQKTIELADAYNDLTAEEKEQIQELARLKNEEKALVAEQEKANKIIKEQDRVVENLSKSMNLATESTKNQTEAQKESAEVSQDVIDTIQELADQYADTRDKARDSIESQIGLFDELKDQSTMSAEEIIQNWKKQQEAIDNYNANLQKAIEMGLAPELLKQLSDGSQESMAVLNELVNSTDVSVQEINDNFANLSDSKDAVADTMAGITSEVDDALDQVIADAAATGPGVAEALASELERNSGVVLAAYKRLGINAANEFSKGVKSGSGGGKVLPGGYTEEDFGPYAVSYSVETASLPHLASGAVIPPRAPFMAVLGDQSSGTNIEAPLATIQEAVRSEIGGMMTGFEAVVAVLERLLGTVENIEIGDTVIGEAVNRYQQYRNIIRGGTT